jgi:CrcB protein
MSIGLWIAVVAVGGAGAISRFLVDGSLSGRAGSEFPFGTLAINVSGSLILGLLTGLHVTGDALLIEGTATIGSYTTFSTWMFETHRLAEDGELVLAIANLAVSLLLGFGAALLGRTIGAHL